MNNKVLGYRGYVGSRAYGDIDLPQHVQNFLIRNYCQKNHMTYLLSATEYKMPGCYMILEEVLSTIESLEGIVLFSIFMLPSASAKRHRIYDKILGAGRTLHAALEDIAIRSPAEIHIVEDILESNKIALTDPSMFDIRDFCYA